MDDTQRHAAQELIRVNADIRRLETHRKNLERTLATSRQQPSAREPVAEDETLREPDSTLQD